MSESFKTILSILLIVGIGVQTSFAQCPNGDSFFEGSGEGASAAKAKEAADMEIARQIFSNVSSVSHDSLSQTETENDYEEFSRRVRSAKVETYLPNANKVKDKKPAYKENGQFVAERYMCKADAAKPYIDSMKIMSKKLAFDAQKLSKQFCEDLHKTNAPRMMFYERVLEGLGHADKALQKEYDSFYKKAVKECGCLGSKLHWEDKGAAKECSDVAFSALSKKLKVEKSECSSGFRLRFACEDNCNSASYGITCEFEPSLAVESCEGERVALLRIKEPVSASDANNYNKAKAKRLEELQDADFFSNWESEIKKRVPKCAD